MNIAVAKSVARQFDWLLGKIVRTVRLNVVDTDHAVIYKRRSGFARRVTPLANGFFRFCHAPISFWGGVSAWQHWEVRCFRMLHDRYHAVPVGDDSVCESRLPGESLWVHLRRGTLTLPMVKAAGIELRRAHRIWSDTYNGSWSHGDAAMQNLIYDPQACRARLIDFEVLHQPEMTTAERHADDLSAFLLDLVGYTSRRQWITHALAFLRSYGCTGDVLAALRNRLEMPDGRGRIWWKIRTNFVDRWRISRRLRRLWRVIDYGALAAEISSEVPAEFRFHSR